MKMVRLACLAGGKRRCSVFPSVYYHRNRFAKTEAGKVLCSAGTPFI